MICEVCDYKMSGNAVNLGEHPLNDDMHRIGSNKREERYPQRIKICQNCLTAHQEVVIPKEKLFFPEYRYRGSLTKDVVNGMEDLVDAVLKHCDLDESSLVVDVGANDGTLLGLFKKKTGCVTVGVDPTEVVMSAPSKIDFPYQAFFNSEIVQLIIDRHKYPKVITFTNVFAHIENLNSLLEAVSLLMGDETLLVIENHYLGSVLSKNQFDTFYAEHIRTYSAKAFEFISEKLGAKIVKMEFPRRYGGNIRVFISKSAKREPQIEKADETQFVQKFMEMQIVFDEWRTSAMEKLSMILNKNRMLIGKSCPARSVMLFSSLQMNEEIMPFVFEHPLSPKIGYCVPGTNIQIVSDEMIDEFLDSTLIIWSWHIAYEVVPYLRDELSFRGQIWSPLPTFHQLDAKNTCE